MPSSHRLLWVNPKAAAQLSYDSALSGFDPERPILIESIEYTLLVRELGRLIRVYEGSRWCPSTGVTARRCWQRLKSPRVLRSSR